MIGAHEEAPLAGIELGGTKCVCVLAHGPDALIDQRTVATDDPETTLSDIESVLAGWSYRALGVASFGPVGLDPTHAGYGHILATNKPGWRHAPLLARLSRIKDAPVALDTDVNGAALAEMRWGCAQGLQDFAYVTVGTGVGVGLIVRGRSIRGLGHSEIGHLRVPRMAGDTFRSACQYHDDCVEGLASGSALRARLDGRSFEDLGEDDAIWHPVIAALAAMCHAIVCTGAPMRIAVGGGVPTRQPHLLPRIERALRESLGGYLALPDDGYIVAPALGDMAGPMGTIALAETALVEG